MKNRQVDFVIIILSIVVALLVSFLAQYTFGGAENLPWDVHQQPKLHAILNSITAVFLLIGYSAIKKGNISLHRLSMFGALVASALFLVSYVGYHALTDSVSFGNKSAIKYLYYFILVTHIILAALIFPLILITVQRALTNQIDAHKRLARFTFPLWLYVAISGVVVYLMLSPYYGG